MTLSILIALFTKAQKILLRFLQFGRRVHARNDRRRHSTAQFQCTIIWTDQFILLAGLKGMTVAVPEETPEEHKRTKQFSGLMN